MTSIGFSISPSILRNSSNSSDLNCTLLLALEAGNRHRTERLIAKGAYFSLSTLSYHHFRQYTTVVLDPEIWKQLIIATLKNIPKEGPQSLGSQIRTLLQAIEHFKIPITSKDLFSLCLEIKSEKAALCLLPTLDWVGEQELGTAISASIKAGCFELAESLIDMSTRTPEQREDYLSEQLRYACATNKLERVKALLNFRAYKPDPNDLGRNGLSALHEAAKKGNVAMVQLLVRTPKTDVNLTDRNGNTALHHLGFGFKKDYREEADYDAIYGILVERGCNPDRPNRIGLNAYQAQNGIYTYVSFERLLGNANGIPDEPETGKLYEGIKTAFPLEYNIASVIRLMPNLSSFSQEKLANALFPENYHEIRRDEVIRRVQKGQLTILPAGWSTHALCLVFYKNYMVVCDRAGISPNADLTIKAFKINPARFNGILLRSIARIDNAHRIEGKEFYHNILPKRLQGEEDALTKKFAKLGNKWITIGNCRFTIKSGIRVGAAFLALETLKQRHPSVDFSQESAEAAGLIDQACAEGHAFSKYWSTYYRLETLNDYLDENIRKIHFGVFDSKDDTTAKRYPRDDSLIAKCWAKIKKRPTCTPALLDRFPNVKAYVDALSF